MTVWQLAWALLRYVMRGRGREPVYVVTEELPDAVADELLGLDLAITYVYAAVSTQRPVCGCGRQTGPVGLGNTRTVGPIAAFPPMTRQGRANSRAIR